MVAKSNWFENIVNRHREKERRDGSNGWSRVCIETSEFSRLWWSTYRTSSRPGKQPAIGNTGLSLVHLRPTHSFRKIPRVTLWFNPHDNSRKSARQGWTKEVWRLDDWILWHEVMRRDFVIVFLLLVFFLTARYLHFCRVKFDDN